MYNILFLFFFIIITAHTELFTTINRPKLRNNSMKLTERQGKYMYEKHTKKKTECFCVLDELSILS